MGKPLSIDLRVRALAAADAGVVSRIFRTFDHATAVPFG